MVVSRVEQTIRPDTETCQISSLLCKIATQDQDAFEDLYRTTSGRLHGVLIRMLGSRAAAEDALQEVYFRIWLRAESYDPAQGSGATWIFSVARNHAIDLLRRQTPASEGTDADTLVASGIDIEQRLTARAQSRRIVACFRTLAPEQARALQGAYLNGESYVELARKHKVPLNTIRTILRRSLQQMCRCMDDENHR